MLLDKHVLAMAKTVDTKEGRSSLRYLHVKNGKVEMTNGNIAVTHVINSELKNENFPNVSGKELSPDKSYFISPEPFQQAFKMIAKRTPNNETACISVTENNEEKTLALNAYGNGSGMQKVTVPEVVEDFPNLSQFIPIFGGETTKVKIHIESLEKMIVLMKAAEAKTITIEMEQNKTAGYVTSAMTFDIRSTYNNHSEKSAYTGILMPCRID